MKVLKEDSKEIVIKMSKLDLYNLRNIFTQNKKFCDENLDKNEYDVAQKIVNLEDAGKRLLSFVSKKIVD